MSAKVISLDPQPVDVHSNGWLLRGRSRIYSLSRGLDSVQCIDNLSLRDVEQLMLMLSHFRIDARQRGLR